MAYKIFLNKQDINDATAKYLKIIEQSIRLLSDDVCYIYSSKNLSKNDIAITIHSKHFFDLWKNNHKQRTINWFQGIAPEELRLIFGGVKGRIYYLLWSFFERFALKRSYANFFVSNEMQRHYKRKYGYSSDNYLIMPCFNQDIRVESFNYKNKYTNPSFVYAGSLSKWQCVDETLLLYKAIETENSYSSITLLTAEQEKGNSLLKKYGIKNGVVKYVPLNEINEELQKYKYGFLIRNDISINRVATPTKMNTYLANGIIPVYSNVIVDFIENIGEKKYAICLKNNDDFHYFSNQIKKMEQEEINPNLIYSEYKHIFTEYFSESKYITLISSFLKKLEG